MRVDAGTGARNPAARGRSNRTATRTPPARAVVVIIFIDRTIFALLQPSRQERAILFKSSVVFLPLAHGAGVRWTTGLREVGAVEPTIQTIW